MGESGDLIFNGLLQKIEETEQLIKDCNKLSDVSGQAKLQRKIEAELKFLKRLLKTPEKLKEEHIRSSNIYHLSALVRSCNEMNGVIKVLETFSFFVAEEENQEEEYEVPLIVDIVADYGKTWVKVATRNPRHLYLASVGEGKYGRKSIVDQVRDMVECSAQNPHMFVPPKVVVRLAAGTTKELEELLLDLGVEVISDVTSNQNDACFSAAEDDLNSGALLSDMTSGENGFFNMLALPTEASLNLDVSTFLAFVSNMTNGHCNATYNEKLLMDLAAMERAKPVKPILEKLFEGRQLICCETAHHDFLEILRTVGGATEKERATAFLQRVHIVPDQPSDNACLLDATSKVKERSKIVFGTGDSLKAITVSANLGFLRAAQSQGIKFVAFVHESRALTEQKELHKE